MALRAIGAKLSPDFTKTTDAGRATFAEKWGHIAVELGVLRRVRQREAAERRILATTLGRLA